MSGDFLICAMTMVVVHFLFPTWYSYVLSVSQWCKFIIDDNLKLFIFCEYLKTKRYLELFLGQFYRCGNITLWGRIAPSMKGIGIASFCIVTAVTLFYTTIIGMIKWQRKECFLILIVFFKLMLFSIYFHHFVK